ncbi:hypothetical protein SMU44_02606 [Streptococcus mutans 11VS1]|nr:hypothetical protein SMU44_02606 [Streptococcus mutans 11VS1]
MFSNHSGLTRTLIFLRKNTQTSNKNYILSTEKGNIFK